MPCCCVNCRGFSLITKGPAAGHYQHDFFQRDKPHLASQMYYFNNRTKEALRNEPSELSPSSPEKRASTMLTPDTPGGLSTAGGSSAFGPLKESAEGFRFDAGRSYERQPFECFSRSFSEFMPLQRRDGGQEGEGTPYQSLGRSSEPVLPPPATREITTELGSRDGDIVGGNVADVIRRQQELYRDDLLRQQTGADHALFAQRLRMQQRTTHLLDAKNRLLEEVSAGEGAASRERSSALSGTSTTSNDRHRRYNELLLSATSLGQGDATTSGSSLQIENTRARSTAQEGVIGQLPGLIAGGFEVASPLLLDSLREVDQRRHRLSMILASQHERRGETRTSYLPTHFQALASPYPSFPPAVRARLPREQEIALRQALLQESQGGTRSQQQPVFSSFLGSDFRFLPGGILQQPQQAAPGSRLPRGVVQGGNQWPVSDFLRGSRGHYQQGDVAAVPRPSTMLPGTMIQGDQERLRRPIDMQEVVAGAPGAAASSMTGERRKYSRASTEGDKMGAEEDEEEDSSRHKEDR